MTPEIIVALFLIALGWVLNMANNRHAKEMVQRKEREQEFKATVEKAEKDINEKSLVDVIADSNKRYDDREPK
jgi:hypothetical protein